MKGACRSVLIGLSILLCAHPILASNFEQEKQGIKLVIDEWNPGKYVIDQPQGITARDLIFHRSLYPFRLAVENNSGRVITLSSRSLAGLSTAELTQVINKYLTLKGVWAGFGCILSLSGAAGCIGFGLANYQVRHRDYELPLKFGFVLALFGIYCWDYYERKGFESNQEEFAKKMLTEEIVIEPGDKIEKLIVLDTVGYNTPEFDVCLYEKDNKSEVIAFHVILH